MNIQIVVPIYNAFEATQNTLQSLRKFNAADDVLIINDASTDSRILTLFDHLPSAWQVFHNEENLGFVKTANRGLLNQPGHSLLLNSDTLLTPGWLQRFRDAIDQIDDLGTATPWSNNAEICSIPQTLTPNQIPVDLNKLATELQNKHQASYPELPTAVGFCMLVSSQAKLKAGYFDEQTFGLGYGEENDYSLRVKAQGLRNVLVDDCYVVHIGNQSFMERSLQPNQSTMNRLLAKHPNYGQLIEKFIENDPLAELRQSIIDKIDAF